VSTPVHLKTLVESGVQVPPLSAIVSATAPMSTELARAAEQRLGGVLVEFFGSTETCVIASRRPARETAWRPHDGVTLEHGDDCTIVSAPWLRQPIAMQDRLELGADGSFTVMGRSNDLVEVAGKRASLADLNRRLLAIPGVIDGAVLLPDDPAAVGVHRLAALVVAPSLQEQDIVHALAQQMDPVFIPRPLVRVERLPRNDTGKLPRSAALELLREARLRRQGLR
jgi:acyl-coenzyme A synthetase/AMP-(fatty) acid ligase